MTTQNANLLAPTQDVPLTSAPSEQSDNSATVSSKIASIPGAISVDNLLEKLRSAVSTSEQSEGRMIPDWTVKPLAWANKYLVEPFDKMGRETGEGVKQAAKAIQAAPGIALKVAAEQKLGIPPSQSDLDYLALREQQTAQAYPKLTGFMEGVGSMVGQTLGDPRNWPFLLEGAAKAASPLALSTLDRLIARGFGADMIYSAASSIPQIAHAIRSGQTEKASELMTQAATSGILGSYSSGMGAGKLKSLETRSPEIESLKSIVKNTTPSPNQESELAKKIQLPASPFSILPEEPIESGAANERGAVALRELGKKYKVTGVSKGATLNPSFISSNGKVIDLGPTWHPTAIANLPENASAPYRDIESNEDARTKFINDTNAVRVRPRLDTGGLTLHVTVPRNGVSPEQVGTLQQLIGQTRYGNLIIETAEKPSLSRATSKELVRPSDVEPMLKHIGVHPAQKSAKGLFEIPGAVPIATAEHTPTLWQQQAADMNAKNGGFTIHPNGDIPTTGKIVSIIPEREKILPHAATAQDIRDYYHANRDVFDNYPELHIGGYGNELNISAIGPNAEEVGKKLDQHSVYDLGEGKEILTGGNNKQKEFPNYPLAQRLQDLKEKTETAPLAVETPDAKINNLYKAYSTMFGKTPEEADRSIRNHEIIGHGIIGDFNGFPILETQSRFHPSAQNDAAVAKQNIDFSSIGTKKHPNSTVMLVTPEDLKKNARKFIDISVGGGTAQEVMDGIPFFENPGTYGDRRYIQSLFNKLGMTPEQSEKALAASRKRVGDAIKNLLANPKARAIIEKYTNESEPGDETLISSAARNQQMMKELREALHGNEIAYDRGRTGTVAAAGSRENVAAGKGGVQTRTLETRTEPAGTAKVSAPAMDIWGAHSLRRWEGRAGREDKPPDAHEIQRYNKVLTSVAKRLNVSPEDVQALQWYFEPRLYMKFPKVLQGTKEKP